MNSPDLQETMALLARFPSALDALCAGLPESWTHHREGDGQWSAYDIAGHLEHLERHHWMARVRGILAAGEEHVFAPVDRWAQDRESAGRPLEELLAAFAALRRENLAELAGLGLRPEDLARRGRHPAFGPVTLGQALATWAAHDLTHLHQLSRTLAHRYAEAVGPWRHYLGVLHCAGHGEG